MYTHTPAHSARAHTHTHTYTHTQTWYTLRRRVSALLMVASSSSACILGRMYVST
jgi:hypothetical protein